MSGFLLFILFTAGVWTLFYFRAPLYVWTLAVTGTLLFWTGLDADSRVWQTFGWLFALAVLIPLNVKPLRRQLLSNRLFQMFKAVMPSMSDTERDALEAGSVWWDGELFSGAPDWNRMLDYPVPKLSDEEQAFLDGPVEELCRMVNDWQVTHEELDLPESVWTYIKEQGFFGMIIPKRYGGLGFSALAHSAVVMKLASRSVTTAVTVMVPNSLGPAELLLNYGTDEQKNYYLPRLARGDEIPCFALTGPDAGSDASAIPDTGVVCRGEFDGQSDVLGIRLNWEKRYITLGPVATLLGLAFKLYDPDELLGRQKDLGITVALIPTNTDGVEIGRRHFPVNIPFQNGPNRGKDVFIPMSYLIGGPQRAGQGWRMLMESLAAGRSISLPALSTGAGKLVSFATGAYARVRTQFKLPIGFFEGVEEPLARIAAFTYMMDAVRTMTAGAVDMGEHPAVVSAIAKYHLTETMRKVVNDGMDIQGGSAICMGPRNFIARSYQALPISITVEGANILTRTLIIFGQGAIRCHPYVLQEMEAARESDHEQGAALFDDALFRHAGFTLSNMARSLFLGLTHARFVKEPVASPVSKYFRQFTRMSAAFALTSDMSMLALGGALKRKEKLSGRLADVLSYLYLGSCTLKRFVDQGQQAEDIPLVRWVCAYSLFNIQQSLIGLLRNYPVRPLAHFLRIMIFPFGQTYRKPGDKLGHEVARLLLAPSESRTRLTKGIFAPDGVDEPLGRLQSALEKVIQAEPVEKKLRAVIKSGEISEHPVDTLLDRVQQLDLMSETEINIIKSARAARRDVITVDDFSQDYLQSHRSTSQSTQAQAEVDTAAQSAGNSDADSDKNTSSISTTEEPDDYPRNQNVS